MTRMLMVTATCALAGCAGLGGAARTAPNFDRPDSVQRYDAYCQNVSFNLNETVMQAGRNGFRLTALMDNGIACFERPSR